MNAHHISLEMNTIRVRTRKLTMVSLGVHLLMLLWLIFMPKHAQDDMTITEITWLEPLELPSPAPPAVVAKNDKMPEKQAPRQKPAIHNSREHFKRERPEADVALEPQTLQAVSDKLNDRLAVLQREKISEPVEIAAQVPASPIGKSTLAGLSTEPAAPKQLTREKSPGKAPIELNRTPRNIQQAATIMNPLPEREATPTRSKKTETQARKMLAGASLTGPVADRPLIAFKKPDYPEWAKREAVEGSVSIYFVVLPDGSIKENIMVQKTSGFSEFDDNAVKALLTWRFEPIKKGVTGEQWGTITFHYRLSGS